MQDVLQVAEREAGKRINFLLLLRVFASLLVMCQHDFGPVPPDQYDNLLRIGALNLSFLFNGSGQAGLFIFFTFSGYLMGKAFYKKRYAFTPRGLTAFYWSRVRRIVPLYAVYVILVFTLGGITFDSPEQARTMVPALLTFRYNGEVWFFSLLGHLWSISTDMQFYLLVPLVMFAFLRMRPGKKTALCMIAVLVAGGAALRLWIWHYSPDRSMTTDFWRQAVHKPLWVNLDLFFSGMLLNFVPIRPFSRVPVGRVRAYVAALALFWVVLAWIAHYGLMLPITTQGARDLWMFGLPSIALCGALCFIHWGERLSFHGSIPEEWGAFKHIVRGAIVVGELTFGLYVWHVVFVRQNIFAHVGPPLLAFFCQLSFTLICGLTLSAITYRGIELPMRGFARLRGSGSGKQAHPRGEKVVSIHTGSDASPDRSPAGLPLPASE